MELGGILSLATRRVLGERILERAIAAAEARGDHAAEAYAHLINCLYYVGRGQWAAADRSAQRCQALCEPMDDRVNWTNAQAVQFWMSHHRAYDDAAADAARRLQARANETGNRQHQAWALRCLAVCAMRRNDPKQALGYLKTAIERLGGTAALNERIPTLGYLAFAQLKDGQVWAARATATEALALLPRVRRPIGYGTLEGYSSLTAVALDAWANEDTREWRRAVKECLRVLDRYRRGFTIGEPCYQRRLGEFQQLSGRLAAARRSFRRGEAAAARLGMPWELKACREALQGR
jgi:tetratricopeptide (TPR) repeat protein